MHRESYSSMEEFANKYSKPGMSVLDVGGADVNGSYKPLFLECKYQSLDFENADIIVKDGEPWPIGPQSYDIVISGQTLEHDPMFWKTLTSMSAALKAGGYMCIIVPSRGVVHRYPVDCYRFLGDSMKAFAKWMGHELIEHKYFKKAKWGDVVGVFKK